MADGNDSARVLDARRMGETFDRIGWFYFSPWHLLPILPHAVLLFLPAFLQVSIS